MVLLSSIFPDNSPLCFIWRSWELKGPSFLKGDSELPLTQDLNFMQVKCYSHILVSQKISKTVLSFSISQLLDFFHIYLISKWKRERGNNERHVTKHSIYALQIFDMLVHFFFRWKIKCLPNTRTLQNLCAKMDLTDAYLGEEFSKLMHHFS